MCEIKEKTRRKIAVGYKAVIKIKGKYYSPCTGLEYKRGMTLPNLRKLRPNAGKDWSNVLKAECEFYNKDMQGKTGVFRHEEDIDNVGLGDRYATLKMTLGGEIYNGKYLWCDLFVGTKIIDFEEVYC